MGSRISHERSVCLERSMRFQSDGGVHGPDVAGVPEGEHNPKVRDGIGFCTVPTLDCVPISRPRPVTAVYLSGDW